MLINRRNSLVSDIKNLSLKRFLSKIQEFNLAKMEIDDKLVNKLAKLSKLEITESERPELKSNFGKILNLVEKLQEVDTEGVEPLIYLTENKNILRKDKVENMIPKAEALENAPSKDSDYFKVPIVLKK